jgi:hypothetical protein
MPAKQKAILPEIYQLKVTLLYTDPPIWRRLLVPASALEQMHFVLQAAMGWDDSHVHEFSVGKRRFGQPSPYEQFMGRTVTEDERKVRLAGILARVGSKFTYTYDFGDTWEHVVVLEKRLPADLSISYPACTDGQLACPPEDCGGIPGYYDLVEALADPDHERHEEMLEWIGDFDPQAFSVDAVNKIFAPRRSRGKAARS